MAGGVSRFPTLTFTGAWEIGGWVGFPYLGAAGAGAAPKLNGGGGSSKLGNVGAAGRRMFNGGADSASNAGPIPDGTARVARFAEGSLTPT